MEKPTKDFQFLQQATRCPVCFEETPNRVQVLRRGEVMVSLPCCSEEHMAITMKNVMDQLDPETRKHVKLQFSNLS